MLVLPPVPRPPGCYRAGRPRHGRAGALWYVAFGRQPWNCGDGTDVAGSAPAPGQERPAPRPGAGGGRPVAPRPGRGRPGAGRRPGARGRARHGRGRPRHGGRRRRAAAGRAELAPAGHHPPARGPALDQGRRRGRPAGPDPVPGHPAGRRAGADRGPGRLQPAGPAGHPRPSPLPRPVAGPRRPAPPQAGRAAQRVQPQAGGLLARRPRAVGVAARRAGCRGVRRQDHAQAQGDPARRARRGRGAVHRRRPHRLRQPDGDRLGVGDRPAPASGSAASSPPRGTGARSWPSPPTSGPCTWPTGCPATSPRSTSARAGSGGCSRPCARPRGLWPTADGRRLYVAGFEDGELQRIDLASGKAKTPAADRRGHAPPGRRPGGQAPVR